VLEIDRSIGLAVRFAGGSARGLLHLHPGHCRFRVAMS
jgi:hypothetical protein